MKDRSLVFFIHIGFLTRFNQILLFDAAIDIFVKEFVRTQYCRGYDIKYTRLSFNTWIHN